MKQLQKKLRSKSGASILIAMVFMMFCLFVGGAVLAAASANGYRAAHLSDQQDFLNQRSACQLLADEIDGDGTVKAKLTVSDIDITYDPVTILANGNKVPDTTRTTIAEHSITFSAGFSASNSMTAVQRVMFETAVCRYLTEKGIDLTSTDLLLKLEGFYYDGDEFDFNNFWCKTSSGYVAEGALDIYGIPAIEAAGEESFTANFTCGTGERLYDFYISFGDYTQMLVSANAYTSELEVGPITATQYLSLTAAGSEDPITGDWDVTKLSKRTTISWDSAYIEKGGA